MTIPPLTRTYFATQDGTPVPAVSAAEMRDIDRIAVEQTGPTLLQMMEHAGMNLALVAIEMLGRDWRRGRVLVLAGPGGIAASRSWS
jgi:NAD(P)H-hydrate epimerase